MKLKVFTSSISYEKLQSWVSLGLNLTFSSGFTEQLHAKISFCMLIYILETKQHYFKMLILLKFHFFISGLLNFLFCPVPISFKFREQFLKFSKIWWIYDQYDENIFTVGIAIRNPLWKLSATVKDVKKMFLHKE